MVDLNETTFTEYITDGTSVIDFWAEWCGPCKTLAPAFEQVAEKYDDIKFAKVNVDSAPGVAAAHGVMSIPTILVIRDGSVLGRIIGARGEEQLEREIESLIA